MVTLTSMGSALDADDMLLPKTEEEEERNRQEEIARVALLPKLGAEFKKHSREAFQAMILGKIF